MTLEPKPFKVKDIGKWTLQALQLLWRESAAIAMWVAISSTVIYFLHTSSSVMGISLWLCLSTHVFFLILHRADVGCDWMSLWSRFKELITTNCHVYMILMAFQFMLSMIYHDESYGIYGMSVDTIYDGLVLLAKSTIGMQWLIMWAFPLSTISGLSLLPCASLSVSSMRNSFIPYSIMSMITLFLSTISMSLVSWWVNLIILPLYMGILYVGMRDVFFGIGENQKEKESAFEMANQTN